MIFDVSHICHVVTNLPKAEEDLLKCGFSKSFSDHFVSNPSQKRCWTRNWSDVHSLSLFNKRKEFPIELIKYFNSEPHNKNKYMHQNTIKHNLMDIPYNINVENFEMAEDFLLNLGFKQKLAENIFIFYSRFHKRTISVTIDKVEGKFKPIDTAGIFYPAFWVKDIKLIRDYSSVGEMSEIFRVNVNGKSLKICLVKIGTGSYFEFLEIERT